MEQVAKFREIAGWTALGAAGVSIINGFVEMQAFKSRFPEGMKPKLADQANAAAGSFAPVVALLVAAVVVAVCVFWRPSVMSRTLALVGLVVSGAAGLLTLVMRLIGLGGDHEGIQNFSYILDMLITLALLGVLGLFFFVAWQHAQALAPAARPGYPSNQAGPHQVGQQPMSQQPMNQPSWQADQASGGAWNRAGDAATGASAAAWGTPGSQNQGWQPSASTMPSAAPQPSAAERPQQYGQPQQPQQYGQPNQYPEQPGAWGQNPNQH